MALLDIIMAMDLATSFALQNMADDTLMPKPEQLRINNVATIHFHSLLLYGDIIISLDDFQNMHNIITLTSLTCHL